MQNQMEWDAMGEEEGLLGLGGSVEALRPADAKKAPLTWDDQAAKLSFGDLPETFFDWVVN